MKPVRKLSVALLTAVGVTANALTCLAQDQATSDRLAAVETAAVNAQSSADNAWVLVSAALVLMMTGPASPFSTAASCAKRMCSPPWHKALHSWQ